MPRKEAQTEVDRDSKPPIENTVLPNDYEGDSTIEIRTNSIPNTSEKKRQRVNQSPRETYGDEMRFPITARANDTLSEKRGKTEKGDDADELFCKTLAFELKELPAMAKCMAKNEIRNVLFKYQMSVLTRGGDHCFQLNYQDSTSAQVNCPTPLRHEINPPIPASTSASAFVPAFTPTTASTQRTVQN